MKAMKGKSLEWMFVSLSFLLAAAVLTTGQSDVKKSVQEKPKENSEQPSTVNQAELLKSQRRDFALSLIISLANESRSYSDLALRPRVLARAADALWDADKVSAREIFHRAWEAAEKGDAEEVTIKTKDNPPPMVIALRRMSGRDLRSEVLTIAARRDRALGEEFLAKLKSQSESDRQNSKNERRLNDNWSTSEGDAKRIQVASELLKAGQVERALEIALPALSQVNVNSISFLSELRIKNAEAADQRFLFLLSRAEFDPSSDANTVSGLSSYAFTPGFYITFKAEGGARTSQSEQPMAPPNLPVNVRDNFFQVAASILLRPLPPPDQDFSSSGRTGKVVVIGRLLPLFDQYAPDSATALRAQLTALAGNSFKNTTNYDNPLLTQGLKREEAKDALEKMQDRIDHAKPSRERDEIYAATAVDLATQGDTRGRDLADKIDGSDRRSQVHQFVDFQFAQLAIRKKQASEAVRLAEAGQLSHTQRALTYTQVARLITDTQRQRAVELLEKAADETGHIDGNPRDRALLYLGIARQLITSDQIRAWGVMDDVLRAANTAEDFTGENILRFSIGTRSGIKVISIS